MWSDSFAWVAWTGATVLLVGLAFILACRAVSWCRSLRAPRPVLAFFHPFANAGGGGERVLWCALQSVLEVVPRQLVKPTRLDIVIYTGDDVPGEQIIQGAQTRFGLDMRAVFDALRLPGGYNWGGCEITVSFVRIRSRFLLDASLYPAFTMLGQSLGAMVVALECLVRRNPDVFVDTTGWAFTYAPVKLLTLASIACYTHYPTITTEMLQKVQERRPDYNNTAAIAQSVTASQAKLLYYRLFAMVYAWMGSLVDVPMANSSWTKDHIDALWFPRTKQTRLVYPPCNTTDLQQFALNPATREPVILSVGQFRPEKDHIRQIDAFALLRQKYKDAPWVDDVRLVIVGGARNAEDEARVAMLERVVRERGLDEVVQLRVNVPIATLRGLLGSSLCGIHTMWNEHFGIGVVELMAAGAIPVAHKSAGPRMDIVVPDEVGPTGFLATTPEEYADALARIFRSWWALKQPRAVPEIDLRDMMARGRAHANRFSDETFRQAFSEALAPLVDIRPHRQ